MSSFQKYLSIVILSGVFLFIMWLVSVVNIFSLDMGRSIESAYNFYSRNPHFGDIHSFLLDYVEGIFWGISIALLIQVAMILPKRSLKDKLMDKFGNYIVYIKKGKEILQVESFKTVKKARRGAELLMKEFPDGRIDMFDLRMRLFKISGISRDDFIAKVKEMIEKDMYIDSIMEQDKQ